MPERELPFHLIFIDQIKVGARFREQLNGRDVGESMTELREGIREHGLLEPIVVDDQLNLIAGFRRYTCCKELGWLEIPCHKLGELTDTQRLEIELEENLLRKQFEWDEVIALRKRIHEIKQQLHGSTAIHQNQHTADGWTLADSAVSLGTSKPRLSADISLAKVVEAVPQFAERKPDGTLVNNRQEVERQIKKLVEQLERELSLRQAYRAMAAVNDIELGSCLEKLKLVPTGTVDCVICDPPYGTDVQDVSLFQGRLYRNDSHFDDNAAYAQELLVQMLPQLKRVMKDNAHAYFFFGITEYPWILAALEATFGSRVEHIPLIWHKDGNRWGTGDWQHHYTRSYEGIFFVTSPQRSLAKVHDSVVGTSTDEGRGEDVKHTAQKPLGLIRFLVEQSTQPGELVLDPTAGHGSVPIVCVQTGRRFWACEQVESAFREMKAQVADELRRRIEATVPEVNESQTNQGDEVSAADAEF